jgi:streptogramin lyase
MDRRQFVATGLGLHITSAIALASQGAAVPDRTNRGAVEGRPVVLARQAKTTRLFKSPGLYPNALAVMTDPPGGLWIGQQKITPQIGRVYNLPVDPDGDEAAWLVDWNGKLLKTVTTRSRNTSGIAYGSGCVWMAANDDPFGIFQVDLSSKQISHRQIPLSIDGNGGGCHGVKWHNGKLWVAALRLGGILRVDPTTWAPEVLIRVNSAEKPRLHDVAFDEAGDIWVVTGNNSTSYAQGKAGLNKYDGKTGELVMSVDFVSGSCDPHGLVWHAGRLISCDAGVHPGWPALDSPHSGYIFQIEIV